MGSARSRAARKAGREGVARADGLDDVDGERGDAGVLVAEERRRRP
jgi:hypothetical protein